jgi:hypothetical protein
MLRRASRLVHKVESHEQLVLGKEPRSKLRGIDSMISRFKNKPKQASGYQTQWE